VSINDAVKTTFECPIGRTMRISQGAWPDLRSGGFTILEMVGVLTILALLAAAVIPNLIRRLDRQAWEREKSDLKTMADSYTRFILRNKAISNYAGISPAIASEMALPLSAITTTPRGWTRAFLVDPGLGVNGAVLPYAQTSSGAASVTNARVMILSCLAGQLPVVSGDDNPDFQAIWDAPEGAKPSSSTWNNWAGKGEDLLIQKLNLEPLFHQLILVDADKSGIKFSIDSTSSIVSSAGSWNAYYFDGTVLGLYDCKTNPQTSYLLQRNISFAFESCVWRGQIQGAGVRLESSGSGSSSVTASNFVNSATAFYNGGRNPDAQSGASQTSVLVAMYTFMFDYVFWATECPYHFDWHGYGASSISSLPEYQMLNDMGAKCNGCKGIDSFSGPNGLLK